MTKMKEVWSNPEYKIRVSNKIREAYKRPEVKEKHSKSLIGHITTQETRDKISKSNTGKIRTPEMRLKYKFNKLGKIDSEETKIKKSIFQNNRIRKEEEIETVRNLGFRNKGRIFTEEHKRKLSESHKGQSRPMSEETKIKLSISHKGKKFSEERKKAMSLARIGKPNLKARGLKRTEEVKLKFRLAKLGKKQSLETIRKRADSQRGENHYNWKGGITPLTRKRTKGFDWKIIADSVRLRDNNTCRNCGLIKESKLPVHHIIPFRISKDNSMGNLITLCNHCHKVFEDRIMDLGYRELAYKLINKQVEVIT